MLAPLRKKFLRANHVPYIAKFLRKAITRRSLLETKYLKTKPQTDLKLHKKCRKNFCSKLYKRKRRKLYESLDMKKVLDSNEFWKTVKPFLSDVNTIFSQISIAKNKRIISEDLDLSKEFSTVFNDAVRSVIVKADEYYLSDKENLSDPVEIVIRKFENPSVQAIKQNISVNQDFYFSNTEVSDVLKESTALNNKENGTFGKIPTKRLK